MGPTPTSADADSQQHGHADHAPPNDAPTTSARKHSAPLGDVEFDRQAVHVAEEFKGAPLEEGREGQVGRVRGDVVDGEAGEAGICERDAGRAQVHGLLAVELDDREGERAEAAELLYRPGEAILELHVSANQINIRAYKHPQDRRKACWCMLGPGAAAAGMRQRYCGTHRYYHTRCAERT